MIVNAYKTHKITAEDNLYAVLDKYLPPLEEKSVVVLASKIVGICEGRIVKIASENAEEKQEQKTSLAMQEADYYLPRKFNQYGFMITVNRGVMVASAGIDESNSNGFLSLWPEDPQKSANDIREYLVKKYNKKHIGVIISDSKLTPLRWGVTGISIAHSGFQVLNDYAGKPDIFGLIMKVEKANIADSLAVTGVTVMGEGAEQQPLAVINDLPFVQFQERNPTQEELDALKIALDDDVYASLLNAVAWKKGKDK